MITRTMKRLFALVLLLMPFHLLSQEVDTNEYYSGINWSTNAIGGYITGARQLHGMAVVEVYVKKFPVPATNSLRAELVGRRNAPTGQFTLISTNGQTVPLTAMGKKYASTLKIVSLSTENNHDYERMPVFDRRGIPILQFDIMKTFKLRSAGKYSLDITPHLWKISDKLDLTPFNLPSITIPVELPMLPAPGTSSFGSGK